jgi:hypothetical protein
MMIWTCDECGSPDVEVSAWVHINTDTDTGSEGPCSDPYCGVCEGEARITCRPVVGIDVDGAMMHARQWSEAWAEVNDVL